MLKRPIQRRRQFGMVLIVALIALMIMTLAAMALMRTVTTSVSIAGNLAFEQAAATSSDQAVEAAVTWLENNNGLATSSTATTCSTGSTVLACDQATHGYAATRSDPSSSQTWATFWTAMVAAGYTPVTLTTDSAGNTAYYLIQRMCTSAGDFSSSIGCSSSPLAIDTSSSRKAGSTLVATNSQAYYRITVKVIGPHDTVSFTQAMVAL